MKAKRIISQRWCYVVNYIADERWKERDVFGTQVDLLAELKGIQARGHEITRVRRISKASHETEM